MSLHPSPPAAEAAHASTGTLLPRQLTPPPIAPGDSAAGLAFGARALREWRGAAAARSAAWQRIERIALRAGAARWRRGAAHRRRRPERARRRQARARPPSRRISPPSRRARLSPPGSATCPSCRHRSSCSAARRYASCAHTRASRRRQQSRRAHCSTRAGAPRSAASAAARAVPRTPRVRRVVTLKPGGCSR